MSQELLLAESLVSILNMQELLVDGAIFSPTVTMVIVCVMYVIIALFVCLISAYSDDLGSVIFIWACGFVILVLSPPILATPMFALVLIGCTVAHHALRDRLKDMKKRVEERR